MTTETQNEAERYLTIIEDWGGIEHAADKHGVEENHVRRVIEELASEATYDESIDYIDYDEYVVTYGQGNRQLVWRVVESTISDDEMWDWVLSEATQAGFDEEELDRDECVAEYADRLLNAVLRAMGQCCEPAVDDALVVLDE